MKVVLQKDVKHLGFAGDIVEIKPGYANKLLPSGLAIIASASAMLRAETVRSSRVKSQEEMVAKADEITKLLKDLTLTFSEKVSSGKHLYGSITEADIAEALEKEAKITIEKSKVEMAEHIKELGSYTVTVHLPSGKTVPVKVEVKEQGGEKEEVKKGKAKKK